MIRIEICMGSSCYSRGNSRALELAESYISKNDLEKEIELSGKLCLCNCSNGPNIIVNGILHEKCDPECVIDLIKHYLKVK